MIGFGHPCGAFGVPGNPRLGLPFDSAQDRKLLRSEVEQIRVRACKRLLSGFGGIANNFHSVGHAAEKHIKNRRNPAISRLARNVL
jgi:hypothetical protein